MSVYDLSRLMEETRRVAAEYRRTTGQTLPVTPEIARHDACMLLGLQEPEPALPGVDAERVSDDGSTRYQIKGRAIFDEEKTGHRIGTVNFDTPWDAQLLVLLDERYEATEIYEMDRAIVEEALKSGQSKRGGMTVAKFKALGELVWDRWSGENPDEIMDNRSGS